MTSPGTTRPRRRRGQARQAIIDSASELFAGDGYRGVSIRDIARHAQVSETLIFRNFGTKAALFDEAVRQPFDAFVAEFVDRWVALENPLPNEEMMRLFVEDLYAFARRHKALLFAVIAAKRFGDTEADGPSNLDLGDQIQRLAEQTATEARARGLDHIDLALTTSCTLSMVLGAVLLDDLVLPHGNHPSPERLLQELTDYATGGVLRPPPPRP